MSEIEKLLQNQEEEELASCSRAFWHKRDATTYRHFTSIQRMQADFAEAIK
jgi:hypothetical protein